MLIFWTVYFAIGFIFALLSMIAEWDSLIGEITVGNIIGVVNSGIVGLISWPMIFLESYVDFIDNIQKKVIFRKRR